MGLMDKLNKKMDACIEKGNARVEYHRQKYEALASVCTVSLNEIIGGYDFTCNLAVGPDKVVITPIEAKHASTTELQRTDILEVRIIDTKHIETKGKSVVGRAVVGGALLGGVGAMIGGMSGMNPKVSEVKEPHLVITYRDGDNLMYREFRKFLMDRGVEKAYKALMS